MSHLFFQARFNPDLVSRWCGVFPVPEHSPAHRARALRLRLSPDQDALSHFAKHIPYFSSIQVLSLEPISCDLLTTLPQTLPAVHYPHVKGSGITLDAIHAAMMRLPGLNSLSDGCFSNTELPLGVENLPKGEFHRVLKLHAGLAHRDVFNMLTNIPTGLHFTRVDIAKVDGNFFSDALTLVKACEHSV